jgi:DNA-binding winged helix-turn-helix (wHTH) protein/Flp pilus assembly protein TadD
MHGRGSDGLAGGVDTREPLQCNLDRILMMLGLDPQGFPSWQGAPLHLPPKERTVLALLIRCRPAVVDKQAFADEAWAGRPMSDESLARCISRLRRALPEVRIESVYGAGYRLAAAAPSGHARLLVAAQAAPQVVETHLHARALAQRRTPHAMQSALALLRSLVAAHPGYASARVTLAETLAAAASWGLLPGRSFAVEGLAQLDEAQRIDAQTPAIDTCRAWLFDLAWRFDAAEQGYRQALAAASGDADALFLHGWHQLALGDPDGAIERFGQAAALQPFSPLLRAIRARALVHAGRPEAALHELQATCRDHPDAVVAAIFRVGLLAYLHPQGSLVDEARQLAEQRDTPPYALSVLSYVLARCGQDAQALALIDACLACSASSACSAALHAAACLALGDAERAARLLVEAVEAHCAVVPMVLRDPALAALRGHPRVEPLFDVVFGTASAGAAA